MLDKQLKLEGIFTRTTLPNIIYRLAASEQSGQCLFETLQQQITLVFLARQVVAASTTSPPILQAESAIAELLTWASGDYQFLPEQVFLARVPREHRIRLPLSQLLPEFTTLPIDPPQPELPPSLASHSLEPKTSSALNDLELMPKEFIIELEKICKTQLGPVGTLVLQDAADTCAMDLLKIARVNAPELLIALLLEIPAQQKTGFQAALEVLKKQFKLR